MDSGVDLSGLIYGSSPEKAPGKRHRPPTRKLVDSGSKKWDPEVTPLLAPLPARMRIMQRHFTAFTAFHSTPSRFFHYTRPRSSKYNIRELKDATVSERAAAEIAIAHGFQHNRCLMMTANHDPVYSVAVSRLFLTAALLEGTTHVAEDSAGKIVGAIMSFGPGTEFLHTTRQKEEALAPLLACLDNRTSWWLTNEFIPEYSTFLDSSLGPGTLLDSWHLQLASIHPDHARSGIGKHFVHEVINQV
ncbi:hypothetical protein PC9H_002962 [Pleurotus ostreatus]|uniref:N-acetyltransferase domain-containing protein n=1 Tax=Pleurotus ostreatus TaxID=5322 RepID=A0A8H7A1G0_PLEOS|nr:uncharacterized protein PC9H_002962 [Pleurotus ostreatus]KAF7436136.1 hypothetical protein PC9H_002962 [Pleurotus ostreatus]